MNVDVGTDPVDVAIIGGGPAGLAAALILGRARLRIVVLEAGPARNAAAAHIQGFVTRDGTPPAEFRRIARDQLAPYTTVELRDARATRLTGELGAFTVEHEGGVVHARRVVLATGMVDVLPELPGFRELWGSSIAQCPYCHGWEARDRRWGLWATGLEMLEMLPLLRHWSTDLVVFTDGRFPVPAERAAELARDGVALEERPIARLAGASGQLTAVELADGTAVPCGMLFARPPQRQTAVVESAGLALDELGFVTVDAAQHTSRPGVYAAGDLTTQRQGALVAAAAGAYAAYALGHALAVDRSPWRRPARR